MRRQSVPPPLLALARAVLVALSLVAASDESWAQPFNVRAWYAQGQVFVVWQMTAPPATPTDTVEIYASPAAQVSTANMDRVGRLFFPEYTGARLQSLVGGARLLVPGPGGGTYRLAADEGVFVYTPRSAGVLFFAVVDTGSTMVNAGNSVSTLFDYDPVGDPVRPHAQFDGATPGGFPYTAYVVWAEGRDDVDNRRPDIPVLGDSDKNGVPHVFVVAEPIGGLPPGPLSCVFAHHGGGGEYELFLPGVPARADLSLPLTDGIVVSADDSIYINIEGDLGLGDTAWFGYSPEVDPFLAGPRTVPSDTAVVVNFTQRRVHWILDWLLSPGSPYPVDPDRVAAIGHSGGGRGVSHLTRAAPDRYASVVIYTPPSDLTIDDGDRDNILQGDWDQNLDTNLVGIDGAPIGVTDVFTMHTRLSVEHRDAPLTRVFYGKRDEKDAASWSTGQRAVVDALNESGLGFMIFWDEREHGVNDWSTETSDLTDDHDGPWPDVGQWVAPERTIRPSAQALVNHDRAGASYPGFFNVDADFSLPGRQPDPGPGGPDLGEPWGTWGGYLDWSRVSLVDEADHWECTVFAAAFEPAAIDNAPVTEFLADLTPRKTTGFNPAEGATVYWYAMPLVSGVVAQQGQVVAGEDGVVTVAGLQVPRADITSLRVVLSTTPRCVGGTLVTAPAPVEACPGEIAELGAAATGSGPFEFRWEIEDPASPGVWNALEDGPLVIGGIAVGLVAGSDGPTVSVQTSPSASSWSAVLRSVAMNACGETASDATSLSVGGPGSSCRCSAADLAEPAGVLDLADISAFVTAFVARDPVADLVPNGVFDLADLNAFVTAFLAGCESGARGW